MNFSAIKAIVSAVRWFATVPCHFEDFLFSSGKNGLFFRFRCPALSWRFGRISNEFLFDGSDRRESKVVLPAKNIWILSHNSDRHLSSDGFCRFQRFHLLSMCLTRFSVSTSICRILSRRKFILFATFRILSRFFPSDFVFNDLQ